MIEYATESEALEAIDKFKRLFALTHWDIRVQLVDELDECWGTVHTNPNKRQAVIRLLTRAGLKPQEGEVVFAEFDHEKTLVHEMLHLHLAPLDPLIVDNPLSEQIVENAIHALTLVIKRLLDIARTTTVTPTPSIQEASLSENED